MAAERPPDEPGTLAEWLWRIKRYDKGIFVRQQRNGKWCNVALADLDPKTWGEYVARWLQDGTLPVRVKEPEELSFEDRHPWPPE